MSLFAQHITDVVNSLSITRDRKEMAQALIRERVAEAKLIAGQIRKVPEERQNAETEEITAKLDDRAARLEGIAAAWGTERTRVQK